MLIRSQISFGVVVLVYLLAAPHMTRGQEAVAVPAEKLLSKQSLAYIRFDGLASHRDGYENTVFASVLREDFGPLLQDLEQRVYDAIGPQLLSERLLDGVEPDQLLKVQSAANEIPGFVELIQQHGVVAGVELITPLGPKGPQAQLTLVFPGAGSVEHRSAVFGAFRLLAMAAELDVQESTYEGRTILTASPGEPITLACWQEGSHVVVTAGTEEVSRTVHLAEGKRDSLLENKLYQKVSKFEEYETVERGFADMDTIQTLVAGVYPPAAKILDELGLRSLKTISFQAGFEGDQIRTTIALEAPGERKGLMRMLASEEAIDFSTLPPSAPDSATVSVAKFNAADAYDYSIEALRTIFSITDPRELPEFNDALEEFEGSLGVNLRRDVFACLGDTVVSYNAPSEGPLNLGAVICWEVVDEKKLLDSLNILVQSLGVSTGADISLKSRTVSGGTIYMVRINEEGFPFVPTYAIKDGWLSVSFLPQPVQGFLMRTEGGHKTWEPPANVAVAVTKYREQDDLNVTAVMVNDPAATFREVLSVAPVITQFATTVFGGSTDFDISLIPNAQAVTEKLNHNVTIVVNTGEEIRFEGYASVPMPIQLSGIQSYGYLFAIAALGLGI